MGQRLDSLVKRVRDDKGPFFIARLCLRLSFPVDPGAVADSPAREQELIEACGALGYDLNSARVVQRLATSWLAGDHPLGMKPGEGASPQLFRKATALVGRLGQSGC